MPASSKMDPPLVKAEPIGNRGSTSEIVYLRSEEKVTDQDLIAAIEVRIWERNSSADTNVSAEGEELLQAQKQRIPCSLWLRPRCGRLLLYSPCRLMLEQRSTCSPQSPYTRAGGCT